MVVDDKAVFLRKSFLIIEDHIILIKRLIKKGEYKQEVDFVREAIRDKLQALKDKGKLPL
jgi:Arc/MetJ-type ribon-helix-helix transcriptional regulator